MDASCCGYGVKQRENISLILVLVFLTNCIIPGGGGYLVIKAVHRHDVPAFE